MPDGGRWLDRAALAEHVSVRVDYVARLVKAGKLPAPSYHLGPKCPRWDRAAVDARFEGGLAQPQRRPGAVGARSDHQAGGKEVEMSDKTRVVETEDGRFMPQMKVGWFGRWKFMRAGADTDSVMLVIWLQVDDPAKAAVFSTEAEAKAFLDRFNARVTAHWRDHETSLRRAQEGIRIKAVR